MTKPAEKNDTLTPIQSWDEVPEFANEAEEADFWSCHSFGDGLLENAQRGIAEEMAATLSKTFAFYDIFYRRYAVPDLVSSNAHIIFVLASPDADEVFLGEKPEARYPAAGKLGRIMAKTILGDSSLPLGYLLKYPSTPKRYTLPDISHIGIMYACPHPLESNVYAPRDKERYSRELEGFGKLTNGERDEDALRYVTEHLQERLQSLPTLPLLIPCGELSQRLVQEVVPFLSGFSVMENVPCPLEDAWKKDELQRTLQEVLGLTQGTEALVQ